MDLVDSVSLLDEMIFLWNESTPFCALTDIANLSEDHSLEGMLVDMEAFPEIIRVPEPPHPTSAHIPFSAPEKRDSSPLWPCESSTLTSNSGSILQAASVSGNVNPLVASFGSPTSPQSASVPFTPPAVKPKRSHASKGGPKLKSTVTKTKKLGAAGPEAAEQVKENRAPTQAEHIIRERQRRDDMAAKYLILESLLPPASKRERAVVVEDATLLVKTLQQKKAELLKRRAHLKLATPNQCSPRSKNIRLSSLHDFPGTVVTASGCMKQQNCSSLENCKYSDSPSSSSDGIMGQKNLISTSNRVVPSGSISAINVHMGEDIVVEMVWSQPRPNFHSVLLGAVESLGLEVRRCSIIRVPTGFIQCIITCTEPQVPSQLSAEIQSSANLIMGALRTVLTQSS